MSKLPACPQYSLKNTYLDGGNHVCPDCGFEWSRSVAFETCEEAGGPVKDANSNLLTDSNTVILPL